MRLMLAKLILRTLSLLPMRLLYVLAIPAGWLVTLMPWRKHDIIRTNLALCFPMLDSRQLGSLHRKNITSMIRLGLEAGAVWYWRQRKLLRHVRQVEGHEHFDHALAQGRGVLIVGSHIGNWEMLTLFCATLAPMVALYRAPADARLNDFIVDSRQRSGATMVPSGSYAMRHMLKQLHAGGLVGLLCDQQPKQGEGVFAPFFGVPALTMTLVNRLARRTGCEVIMVSCQRLTGGVGWRMVLEPADEAVADDDPVVACAALNASVERQVNRAPEDYLWLYKRFGIRPDGARELYPKRRGK